MGKQLNNNWGKIQYIAIWLLISLVQALNKVGIQMKMEEITYFVLELLGISTLSYFGYYLLFSTLNNKSFIPKLSNHSQQSPSTSIIVTVTHPSTNGLKNLRQIFARVALQNYQNISKIIVVGDQTNKNKELIERAFQEVFPHGLIIKLDRMYGELGQAEKFQLKDRFEQFRFVYVSQPWNGRIQAVELGAALMPQDIQYALFTDSEAMLQLDCVSRLVKSAEGYENVLKQGKGLKPLAALSGRQKSTNQYFPTRSFYNRISQQLCNIKSQAASYFGSFTPSYNQSLCTLFKKSVIDEHLQNWAHSQMYKKMNFASYLLQKGYSSYCDPKSKFQVQLPSF